MNETVQNLVYAIADGDALGTQNAFAAAMAEKLSVKLEDMRMNMSQNMFNQLETVAEEVIEFTEEEWNSLSEEEKSEYELDEASMFGAMRTVMKNKGTGDDTHGRYDTPRATQAAARKKVVAAKKVIKRGGGDYSKVAARADAKTERENEM